MKRMRDKTKSYEIFYKILRSVLYFGIAGTSIVYIVVCSLGKTDEFFYISK